MGPPSYMRSVVDRNVGMRRMLLGYKPVQRVTVLNTVDYCNKMVL